MNGSPLFYRPHEAHIMMQKKIPSLWAEGRDRFLILQTDVFIILIIETL